MALRWNMEEDVLGSPLAQIKAQILTELNHILQENSEIDLEDERQQVMTRIECEVLKIVQDISEGKSPVIQLPNPDWASVDYDDGALRMKPRAQCSTREIRWSAPRSRPRMALLVSTLARAYKLLATRSTITRRALYYEQAGGARSQRAVDAAAADVGRLLGVPAWRLGLLASGKALVAGPLLITTAEGGRIDCARAAAGQLVPQDVAGIRELRADSARLVLLVEKDAVFQKLLDQGVQQALGPCILLTGKGFPDVNARLFLRRLWDSLRLPVLALVDADPYGIEIMCVYRFGSLALCDAASRLATPAVRWLGVLPSELAPLGVPAQPLTAADRRKLAALARRPYVRRCPAILHQVQTLLTDDHKAEIEAVAGLSREYLVRGYLPNKIRCRDIV
ncbi:meiotic recombination protein SPO11 [Schistocerca cancellata]|uniref:meiotic recombination protein SPO11 n=1 Tax=Schistocerca cancellata TaxID=274614 RepID=UPI0021194BA3|nr:meiotic recombination protein SPO11 [Schistocerca cancellata]